MRIAIAQINCTVGDLQGNAQKIKAYIRKAKASGVDLVCFPELSVTGYPPEDLLIKPKFIQDNLSCLKEIVKSTEEIIAVVGFVDKKQGNLYNAAAIIKNKKIIGIYHKAHLPNYGVFDEKRYFSPGVSTPVFKFKDTTFAVNICEDIWHIPGPVKLQAKKGAKIIININSSPYYAGKAKERQAMVCKQAKKNKVLVVYANLVGGQDELVFDGQSIVADKTGKVIGRASAFREELFIVDLTAKQPLVKPLGPEEEIYQALLLGLKDYVAKNGFKKVAIGLSGGVDSALVAVLAVDALGKENVNTVFMPSRHSSPESFEDAKQLAENLGVNFLNIPIEDIFKVYLGVLEPHFSGLEKNITEENLQARIRGNIMMALSNKFGWLVLTTGNKSEMSTGYATLYGDMAGGFAVIKDVPKTLVYKLVEYRNGLKNLIPQRIITKEPTAELRENQKDSDSLPIYAILDPILEAYVEDDLEAAKIIGAGFDRQTVEKVARLVDLSEYKRRQSPPGIKITPKAFGRDRRMPITNKYRG